jgi:hypothetical protein
MPWPPPIDRLLARPDSRAAQALRWGLRGLSACLRASLDEVPDDPGGDDLQELLSALESLLAPAGAVSGPALPVDEPAPPPAEASPEVSPTSRAGPDGAGPRLLPLSRAVAAEPRFREVLRRSPLRDGSDDDIWNDVQRLLLRVAPELGEEWRRRSLSCSAEAGGRPSDAGAAVLPLGRDEAIYPGLTGAVQAPGLCSKAGAPLAPQVPEPADPGLRPLAGVVSAYLWFIERDPHLHHCLQGVFRFGVPPLTGGGQRQRYREELLRRWDRARSGSPGAAGHGLKDWMKALLDLDEALQSLVYQPLADERSWWGRLQREAREVVFRARDRAAEAGGNVHLQLLGGSFADVSRLAPESLQVDFGVPGEVAACLRVWARIDGEELKGRVLYRSRLEAPCNAQRWPSRAPPPPGRCAWS